MEVRVDISTGRSLPQTTRAAIASRTAAGQPAGFQAETRTALGSREAGSRRDPGKWRVVERRGTIGELAWPFLAPGQGREKLLPPLRGSTVW
jgi:hypothetical protein